MQTTKSISIHTLVAASRLPHAFWRSQALNHTDQDGDWNQIILIPDSSADYSVLLASYVQVRHSVMEELNRESSIA